jgi:hypothetical protein
LTALKVEPNINEKGVSIRGRDSRQQIFVSGVYSSGQFRDFTRKAAYTSAPAGIVKIAAMYPDPGPGQGSGRGVRAGEAGDLMARADELGNKGGADPAGRASDKNAHA